MTGASVRHAMLVSNLIFALRRRLRPGCAVLANDLKVVSGRAVRYPDVTVVCGPLSPSADRAQPTQIVEVLSPSTALTDRRVKGE
jgi:Uma2 family endonuclease